MDGGASGGGYRPSGDAGIKTFLIADVRGYTMFTNERGDEAAAKLAAKFAVIVREGVEAWGGSLVELRGDEGLAVFSSARQAIRAAMDLQSAFVDETLADPSLPLGVGIGLDAGEAVPLEGGYRGGALNLAARLCGQAGPGETLASQEVVHLARKVEGVRYVERGAVHLKGLDQPALVIRVMLEEGDPAERLAGVLRTPPPARHHRPRRRTVVLVGAVASITLVAATLPFILHHANQVPALAANGIQLIDTASGERVGSVPLPRAPGGLASGGGSVWVSDAQAGAVVRLDPSTRAAVDTIPVGRDPAGIAFTDGAVWVALSGDSDLARIDPSTGTVVARVSVGNGPTGVAGSPGFVWVTDYSDDTVVRVDTTTNEVVANSRVDVGNGPVAVAANAAGAWVANSGDGTVTRIPLGGEGPSTIHVGNGPSGIAIGPTAVWVTNGLDGTLSRIDADTGVVTTTPVGDGPTGVTVDTGTVWVADHFGGAIARVDAATGAVRPIQMDAAPVAVTLLREELWVAASAPRSAHRGGTFRFASIFGPPESIDPAIAYTSEEWQILSLTNDGLVGFERVGGPQGGTIVADLASSVPAPSDGGRTYTFQVRPGIHYSSGASVEPQDFRLGIERALLVPKSPVTNYYSGIVGAARCISVASCDLTDGIVLNDATRTVTFHLTAPDPDFLYKLALPFADAVPAGTPLRAIGGTPIPATGPYMIASYAPGATGAIELVRNPRFVEWSWAAQPDGYPDRIQGSYGISAAKQASSIEQGRLDAMIDSPPAPLLSQLDTRYPSQLHEGVLTWIIGFALNTRAPPFNNVRVRRALNYAVDRSELVRISGGTQLAQVSCQILPPDFPGYRPYCPYTLHPSASGTWSAPDPRRARRLVAASGTRGAQIAVWTPSHLFPLKSAGRYLVSILTGLGYQARLHVVSGVDTYLNEVYNPHVSATMQVSAYYYGADYPEPSGLIVPLFACASVPAGTNASHFCDRRVQADMNKTLAMQASEPATADEAWGRVDRSIVDRAPLLALPTPLQVYFVSSRTGNVQVSPQWGMLLSQLWIR